MLVAAAKRKAEEAQISQKLADFRAGVVAAAVYTAGGVHVNGDKDHVWVPGDFFASLATGEEQVSEEAEIAAHVRAMEGWAALFGKSRGTDATA